MSTAYELLYIIPTSYTDDEVGTIETKIGDILTKYGATVASTRRLGKFRFAYPIKQQRHGHYIQVLLSVERPMIAKIEEQLRITPEVLRHLMVRADELGAEQKFDLVQFTEVTIESRDDRPRRRDAKPDGKTAAAKDETLKAGVAALEEKKEGEQLVEAGKGSLSTEEVDAKIASALKEDAGGV